MGTKMNFKVTVKFVTHFQINVFLIPLINSVELHNNTGNKNTLQPRYNAPR